MRFYTNQAVLHIIITMQQSQQSQKHHPNSFLDFIKSYRGDYNPKFDSYECDTSADDYSDLWGYVKSITNNTDTTKDIINRMLSKNDLIGLSGVSNSNNCEMSNGCFVGSFQWGFYPRDLVCEREGYRIQLISTPNGDSLEIKTVYDVENWANPGGGGYLIKDGLNTVNVY